MNIARPRVSVIIPAYNVEKYLGECLQSMIDQTEKSLEILVINDGSADKTLEVARRWAQYDPRIKIFDKENGGAATARNLGFDNAKGTYIAVQDADDYSHPLRFQQQADFLDHEKSVEYVGSYAKRVGARARSLGFITPPIARDVIRDRMHSQIAYVHASLMFRRTIIDEGTRYNTALISSQDWEMLSRISLRYDGANIPKPFYYYRNVDGQLTQRFAVAGTIRSLWTREQLRRRRHGEVLLGELPQHPTRDDAIRLGLDGEQIDDEVLSRFELILRLNRRSGNSSSNQDLIRDLKKHMPQMSHLRQNRARTLSIYYGQDEWLALLQEQQVRSEYFTLIKREAMYYAHIIKRGLEFRDWNYRPKPVIL